MRKDYITTDSQGNILYWTYSEVMEIIEGRRANKQ